MILDMLKIRGFVNIPTYRMKWEDHFHDGIMSVHNQAIKNDQGLELPRTDHKLACLLNSFHGQSDESSRGQALARITLEKGRYDDYSDYVPIQTKCYADRGECEKEFSYAQYISDHAYKIAQNRFEADIKNNIGDLKTFRQVMCEKYNPFMSFTQKINLYKRLLCYGSQILNGFKDPQAMLYNLSRYEDYLPNQTGSKIKNNVSVTVQKHESIKAETVGNTMKALYCPTCFLYDCEIHLEPKKSEATKNKIKRQQHLQKAIKMLNPDCKKTSQKDKCSPQCFRNLTSLSQDRNFSMMLMIKQVNMSDLTKSIIQIGIEMFSFQPCLIRKLLPSDILCSQIYKYLETQLNVCLRIGCKMYPDEIQSLMSEQTSTNLQPLRPILNPKSHRKRGRPPKNECSSTAISCKCKRSKGHSCITHCCPCYQNAVQCSELCGKACSEEDGCWNRQIQLGMKRNIKIGLSTIHEAGFGLFSITSIPKDSLVTIYLGEKINALSTEIREQLRKNNSFYNFEQKETYLDSRFIGNKSRFINHKGPKQANLKVRIMKSLDQFWTAFYATRDIEAHEQLFFNYDGDGQIAKHHADKYPFISPQ